MSNSRQEGIPDAARLHGPLARLMRPLVRLLIRSGVTFPILSDLLRELYVDVAEHDFGLPKKGQTDSRVSLLTGIHRKEVRRLRGSGATVSVIPQSLSRMSRIVAVWLGDPAYAAPDGKPLALPRSGPAPSFESLVETVTRDVRPRAVLDEALERKLVGIDAEDRVVLTELGVTPSSGSEQQLYYFGRNLHDHLAAATANVIGEGPRFLERAVHYDGLSLELARQLEQRACELAIEALQTANREALQAVRDDKGGPYRWNFGAYVFAERRRDEPPPEESNR